MHRSQTWKRKQFLDQLVKTFWHCINISATELIKVYSMISTTLMPSVWKTGLEVYILRYPFPFSFVLKEQPRASRLQFLSSLFDYKRWPKWSKSESWVCSSSAALTSTVARRWALKRGLLRRQPFHQVTSPVQLERWKLWLASNLNTTAFLVFVVSRRLINIRLSSKWSTFYKVGFILVLLLHAGIW